MAHSHTGSLYKKRLYEDNHWPMHGLQQHKHLTYKNIAPSYLPVDTWLTTIEATHKKLLSNTILSPHSSIAQFCLHSYKLILSKTQGTSDKEVKNEISI